MKRFEVDHIVLIKLRKMDEQGIRKQWQVLLEEDLELEFK